jgi:hypothetical protein
LLSIKRPLNALYVLLTLQKMKPQRQIRLDIVADMFKRIQDEAFSGLRHLPAIFDLDKKHKNYLLP